MWVMHVTNDRRQWLSIKNIHNVNRISIIFIYNTGGIPHFECLQSCYETGGHSKTGGIRNVDMAKNGKNQLDGTCIERRSVNIGRRGKISYIHNQSKTKKLDGTPAERRLSSDRNNGGKNGGEERKRKTKAKTIGLDDVGGIR